MAIKERKQITGTAAQIKGFAGHNGVLAYATDTKHLHVLSGVAGTTTELANRSDIPAPVDISGKADTTYVNAELAKKANTKHTHAVADVTGLQTVLNTINDKIPKAGNRGKIGGYAESNKDTSDTINVADDSYDSQYCTNGTISVRNGSLGQTWTKVVMMSGGTVTLDSNWMWVDGEVPELVFPCILICHWSEDNGIAGIVKGVA